MKERIHKEPVILSEGNCGHATMLWGGIGLRIEHHVPNMQLSYPSLK